MRKTILAEDRFWSKVEKTENCWEWIGRRYRGYGYFDTGSKTRGDYRLVRAHRFSWEFHFGPIRLGALICHRCDNPACVRPDHLFLGTQSDNMADRERKGRANHAVGERHPCAKLNREKVQEIRKLYETGEFSYRELGRRFGVSHPVIRDIVKERIWHG